MKEQDFGNNYDLTQTISFFKRWKKVLIWVFVAAFAISVAASFLVKPRYTSTAIIFPTNSNRISKAIMDYHYSLDFMDYGTERDCEYAIQTLTSRSMQDAVCLHFGLMEHYDIRHDDPHKQYKLDDQYSNNVTIRRTDYLGVKISVTDINPEWAANMANYIADYYDTLCHQLHHARATDAYTIMSRVCTEVEKELIALEDSTRLHPQNKDVYTLLIADKSKKLADLQTRATQTKVDMSNTVSYKFWLDKASPADKKSYPNRLLIALLGSFGALFCCIFILLLIEWRRKVTSTPTDNR
ncbi:MAG: hypothetical protein IJ764_03070 [Bacteroidales bacterium]|nr:hypothetical protein [Bacteroidales bacterium]